MALDTYYSGPPDLGLGQITQGMLQDQAQQNAATANQANYFAALAGQRAAERTARNRDLSSERIATMPYERMTPYQAATVDLQRNQQKFYEAHPELFGDSRTQIERSRQAFDQATLEREAEGAASAANAILDGYKASAKRDIYKKIYGFLPLHIRDWNDKDSNAIADLIIKGEKIPGNYGTSGLLSAAQNEYLAGYNDTLTKTIAQLKDSAHLIRFDPDTKKWVSVFAKAALPGAGTTDQETAPPPPPTPPPAAATGPSDASSITGLPYWLRRGAAPAPGPVPAPVAPAPGSTSAGGVPYWVPGLINYFRGTPQAAPAAPAGPAVMPIPGAEGRFPTTRPANTTLRVMPDDSVIRVR